MKRSFRLCIETKTVAEHREARVNEDEQKRLNDQYVRFVLGLDPLTGNPYKSIKQGDFERLKSRLKRGDSGV